MAQNNEYPPPVYPEEEEAPGDEPVIRPSQARTCSVAAPAGMDKPGFSYNRHEEGMMIALDKQEHETLAEYVKRFAEVLDIWIAEAPGSNFWNQPRIRANLTGWQQSVAYEGFNPAATIASFKYLSTNPIFDSRDEDLAFMLMLFFERGSDITKLTTPGKAKMSREGFFKCSAFHTKYKLASQGKDAKAEILTLPRLALSFPVYSCVYMDHRISWPVMPQGLTGKRRSVACQALGTLIPLETPINMEELIRAHAWFQYRLSLLINEAKFGKLSIAERKEETMKFIMVSMKSPYPMTVETKLLFLREREILLEDNTFHREIRNYSNKWLNNDFSFDAPPPRPVAPAAPDGGNDTPPDDQPPEDGNPPSSTGPPAPPPSTEAPPTTTTGQPATTTTSTGAPRLDQTSGPTNLPIPDRKLNPSKHQDRHK